MRYRRNYSKSEQQHTVLIAIVFAVAGGLVLVIPTSINFQLVLAQEEQQQFGPPLGPPPGQFSATQADASTNKTCTLTPSLIEVEGTPQQTEGPYFVDNMPNRSDITQDTSNGSIQEGIPLKLVINVYDVDGDGGEDSCIPLRGALVDIWHANPEGIYSGIQAARHYRTEFPSREPSD